MGKTTTLKSKPKRERERYSGGGRLCQRALFGSIHNGGSRAEFAHGEREFYWELSRTGGLGRRPKEGWRASSAGGTKAAEEKQMKTTEGGAAAEGEEEDLFVFNYTIDTRRDSGRNKRERVGPLFIGTQFSNLYTVDTPIETV
jgi:hypothetical protein